MGRMDQWIDGSNGSNGSNGSTGMSQCGRMSKEVSKCLYVFRWVDKIG